MTPSRPWPNIAAAFFALVLVGGCATAQSPASSLTVTPPVTVETQFDSGAVGEAEVQIGAIHADEFFASTTIDDWVTQVDHVTVVRIESEKATPVSAEAQERGEDIINRVVSARVVEVIWSHPRAGRELPSSFSFNASGWVFTDGVESKLRVGLPNQPYLLPGHTYLLGLRYMEFDCPGRDPEDGPSEATWAPMGSRAMVPYDDIIGTGEFEGRETSLNDSTDKVKSFRTAMLGKSTNWIADALTRVAAADSALTHEPGPFGCRAE